ncbi:MAG: hypothetical protein NW226_06795 [Microscillaceae bacterium]|nr:hypothetical protein [Microscillaceae bacterium]
MNIHKLKKIAEDWLPPVLIRALMQSYHSLYFQWAVNKTILQQNKQLKGIGRGKRAFLFATGPSIKKENLKLLAGEDCYSLSNFFLHEDIVLLKPKFQFFAPYHPPLDRNNFADWLDQADKRLPPETKIFLGTSDEKLVKEYGLFPKREIYYVYMNTHPNPRQIDLRRPIRKSQTIPLMALPVLVYMGYDEIYLLGCDHNILKSYGEQVHYFYEKKDEIRKNITGDYWPSIIEHHLASLKVFQQYEFYKKIIDKTCHTQVINLSAESWLDAFPKKALSELIEKQDAVAQTKKN